MNHEAMKGTKRAHFHLRRHRIPCLPEGSSPMTILHLSDLHLRAPQRRKRAFLKSLARMQPDLLIGTGDFIGDARSNAAAVDAVTAIGARFGALYVLGSNDYYGPKPKNPLRYFLKKRRLIYGTPNPWRELVEGLNARGWRLIKAIYLIERNLVHRAAPLSSRYGERGHVRPGLCCTTSPRR